MLNCKFGYNEQKIFQPFEINHDIDTPLNEVDPDFQFYSDVIHLFNTKCDYYIEDTFRETITKEYKIASSKRKLGCASAMHLF